MKKSIKRLPKRTQEELNTIVELVTSTLKDCEMIILFGSYARKNYVLWDEKIEFGVHTSYQSDLDILVVVEKANVHTTETKLYEKVTPIYNQKFEHRRFPFARFIVERIDKLNKNLRESQYFFTEIIKDGIKLYDTGNFKLDKAGVISFERIKQIAENEYKTHFPDGEDFLEVGQIMYDKCKYRLGSFQLHQACERFYNSATLVCNNYRPKSHKLEELSSSVNGISQKFSTVFPQSTDFEKRCFDLLRRAYIEARYNCEFVVTKEEYEYMLERIKILKEITESVCAEKFAYYDKKILEEKQ